MAASEEGEDAQCRFASDRAQRWSFSQHRNGDLAFQSARPQRSNRQLDAIGTVRTTDRIASPWEAGRETMSFKRALPWMGWAVIGLMVVSALGFWYLSGQRLRLDEENRRELAHVAHDLR